MTIDAGLIGKFVIVRGTAAGVHAGVLEAVEGQECVLRESRRLWRWVVNGPADFLSGVAAYGLAPKSKIGPPIRLHLSGWCEIIECSPTAEANIREMKPHVYRQ